MSPLERELRARIASEGSIGVADYMAACNAHYYATRDPFGAAGDFITAPEISQMFGELVGAWLADLWGRSGSPGDVAYVELGPGRGTLAVDALRVMRKAGLSPLVHFVETSPVLRAAQAERFPDAIWHEDVETLPEDRPLLIVANEFFDSLPIEQYDAAGRELSVEATADGFTRDGEAVREICPAALEIVTVLGRRLARQGGALLIVDYGYDRPAAADTLQAVSRHAFADRWVAPGAVDLTAHVDFSALAAMARRAGARVVGPVSQGVWLRAMGIDLRTATLVAAAPDRGDEIAAARDRLVASEQMGRLFKAMALIAPAWPAPAGFAV